MSPAVDRSSSPMPWAVGDFVWVHAYGRWRRGYVVKVGTRTPRVRVNYPKRATDDSRGEQWFTDRDAYPMLRGSLDPPVVTSCPDCRVKLTNGRPGEPEERVIARHAARSHQSAAEDAPPSANGVIDVPLPPEAADA